MQSSRQRLLKDRLARIGIVGGGSLVLVALLLIFFYLLYVVWPLFGSAAISPTLSSGLLSDGTTLQLGMDESGDYGYRLTDQGVVEFYRQNGAHQALTVDTGKANITAFAASHHAAGLLAVGLSDGRLVVAQPQFAVSYPKDVRTITPELNYPLADADLQLSDGQGIAQLAFEFAEEQFTVVWQDSQQQWTLSRFQAQFDFAAEQRSWQRTDVVVSGLPKTVTQLLLTPDQRQLFVLADTGVSIWNIANIDAITHKQQLNSGETPLSISLLPGASSLLLQQADGTLSQWFEVRSEQGRKYQQIRQFPLAAPPLATTTEYFRKTIAASTVDGALTLLYPTSERQLLRQQFAQPILAMAFSPSGNHMMVSHSDGIQLLAVDNPHPEISFSALWQKVWYEGYPEPAYVWQSTSGTSAFEAKLSIVPLVFGTVKAALYAMLFAVPIAICGAIYTAYFMTAKVRAMVKPTIEIMEALPTVILGFLAGLWLAPIVETNLPGILLLIVAMPLTILAVAIGWRRLPESVQALPLLQYRELLLLPILLLVGWGCFAISPWIEVVFMGGDGRAFVTNSLGIDFDQRNALVVGLAMGFAVVPTIFSIAEDAIYSVPRHLVNGSLALGATQWQTLTRVVLLTASPGIFSATMMGFGRAVGETMIVLMATGNTALMKWNIFEGMRTLAANIAIEMPESAVGSSHYRVLFLTALVLFVFTFVVNTLAELVRQRLRHKYSNL